MPKTNSQKALVIRLVGLLKKFGGTLLMNKRHSNSMIKWPITIPWESFFSECLVMI